MYLYNGERVSRGKAVGASRANKSTHTRRRPTISINLCVACVYTHFKEQQYIQSFCGNGFRIRTNRFH